MMNVAHEKFTYTAIWIRNKLDVKLKHCTAGLDSQKAVKNAQEDVKNTCFFLRLL